ncbi:hypothetical protein [Pseudophaeobacter leonis]|uniref:hypothetical protein n=1 Tax=Pseudophaeobacter leonis TaxID=1144477 RepID=UPI0009F4EF52|nr:hypothetical protein [Pseudophaeobacter leonis]
MSDLKRLEDLTTGQRALLLKRLAQRGAAEPAPAADPAALSFAQERWLFQDQRSQLIPRIPLLARSGCGGGWTGTPCNKPCS